MRFIYRWGWLALTIVLPLAGFSLPLATQDSETFTVQKLERVVDANGEGAKYLVFTENETFENTDELILFKFNLSDVYGMMSEGGTYKAQVAGIRIPFLSWYRNIISVEELDRPVNSLQE